MNNLFHECDVLIIGGGPAGIAAAVNAAPHSAAVTVVDDNPGWGGQIWRGPQKKSDLPEAVIWLKRAREAKVNFVRDARVFEQPQPGVLLAESADALHEFHFNELIITSGAHERFLPFPGWTLPNVMGAGGLQALVKSGLSVAGKRVVVAGTGPLLPAVAAFLIEHGANMMLIAEQAPLLRLAAFGLHLLQFPAKISQAIDLRKKLKGAPLLTRCWPVKAEGAGRLERLTLRRGRRQWVVPCDYLACGFHLVPNTELAMLVGCGIRDGQVSVNEFQETSVPQVYAAGEVTGIGGVELSLVEGAIAGLSAVGRQEDARKHFPLRRKMERFARSMNHAFALRDELKTLSEAGTIVCRCEDATFGQMRAYNSWRAAKLQTRCGMGPCQGRICGSASEFIFGWKPESVRPPIFPVRAESLAATPHQETPAKST